MAVVEKLVGSADGLSVQREGRHCGGYGAVGLENHPGAALGWLEDRMRQGLHQRRPVAGHARLLQLQEEAFDGRVDTANANLLQLRHFIAAMQAVRLVQTLPMKQTAWALAAWL